MLSKKNKSFYLYVNGDKSPLVIMRKARNIHIKLTYQKTLRNIRYKYFLKQFLKNNQKQPLLTVKFSQILRVYNYAITWYHCIILINFGFIWLNGVQQFTDRILYEGDIFQFIYFRGNHLFKVYYKKKVKKIKKKLKRIGYLYAISFQKKWITRKKNTTRLQFWVVNFGVSLLENILYDFFTFTGFYLEKTIPFDYYYSKSLTKSTVLKLAQWKFRAR